MVSEKKKREKGCGISDDVYLHISYLFIVYKLTVNKLADFNECENETSGCDQECHNTEGSFYCSCNSSYYLDSNGTTCVLGMSRVVFK